MPPHFKCLIEPREVPYLMRDFTEAGTHVHAASHTRTRTDMQARHTRTTHPCANAHSDASVCTPQVFTHTHTKQPCKTSHARLYVLTDRTRLYQCFLLEFLLGHIAPPPLLKALCTRGRGDIVHQYR